MKRRRFWKFALLLAVPLALFATIANYNSWRPRTIKTEAVEPSELQFSSDGRTLILEGSPVYICDLASSTSSSLEMGFPCSLIENGKYLADSMQILSVRDKKIVTWVPQSFVLVGVLADQSTLILAKLYDVHSRALFRWNWRSDLAPKLYVRLQEVPDRRLRIMSDKATLTDEKHIWDLKGNLRFKIPQETHVTYPMHNPSPMYNPSMFIALSDGSKVQIWNCATGKVQGSVAVISPRGSRMIFKVSPDGTMLAAHAMFKGDFQISLWDIESGQRLRQIDLPNFAWEFAFSPDGRTLAVAFTDTVKLWRIK